MIIYTTLYLLRMRAFPNIADDNIVGAVHPGTTLYATGGRAGDWRAVVGPCTDGVWRAGWCAFAYEGERLLHHWGVTPCYASPVASRQPITQLFGENPDCYARWGYRGHNGLDLGTVPGTPVSAIGDGVVAHARFDPTGYGYYVRLDCVDGGIVVFAHLDRLLAYEGQQVRQGQLLGLTGSSGFSQGPHLHIDLRLPPVDDANGYGGRIDPLAYLDWRFLAWPAYLPASWMPWAAEVPA